MTSVCPICQQPSSPDELAEAGWIAPETERRLAERKHGWHRSDGACAACVQDALLSLLREKGERVLSRVVQDVWPIDAEAAFGALPTPLRLRADARFTGRGVTIAMLDTGFYPHADLTRPTNRIRAMIDTAQGPPTIHEFGPNDIPTWPHWNAADGSRWHGLMTTAVAAGNGFASRGLYRGLAPEAQLVLVRARDAAGHITSASIARSLAWLVQHHRTFDIRVASISLGGDATTMLETSEVDALVATLVTAGVTVIVAAGNDGQRNIVPPATASAAITVGGLDDNNVFDLGGRALWHSSYGATWCGDEKPEVVAPSIWVAAPVLPMTEVAREAAQLFERRALGDASCEARIAELKLITPHYQHVEGTSFAAPIVAGIVACMLEGNRSLSPSRIRQLLMLACRRVDGAPRERQGAGAIDAGSAVALAASDDAGVAYASFGAADANSRLRFVVHEPDASEVTIAGSWDSWSILTRPPAVRLNQSLWQVTTDTLPAGTHAYKVVIDRTRWIADPSNRTARDDGFGGTNSLITIE